MNRYTKMYGWLYNTFENNTFTIDDFRMIFPSPQPTKTIHDLIKLDFMKRIKRGKYKIVKPKDFVKKIIQENLDKDDILKHAERKYAFSDSTAVKIWSDGYYWTDFTKGFKPVHIKVLKKDLDYWNEFFKGNDVEYVFEDIHKTLFGLTYVVHPVDKFEVKLKDDISVVPLDETLKFCKKNEFLYRPALEYLNKKYKLQIIKNYEQVSS
ncbi:MAG: hypothetical protein JSU91_06640 [Thermoplasmatales archaeon]|nr:MAG: hypothetical protein JSU91_06640 [Thermoplasmatales archaeon]